jgi:hypothetical protein
MSLLFSFVAMFSSEINDLSYRQIKSELKKRKLDSSGKKVDIVKRFKIVYKMENQSMPYEYSLFMKSIHLY